MLSDWIRKNNVVFISESRLKGLIVLSLMVAVIPFVSLMITSWTPYRIPVYADTCDHCCVIEIVGDDQRAGIYHVPSGMSVNRLLKTAGVEKQFEKDFTVKTGMKLVIRSASDRPGITVAEIQNTAKISVGLPIDVNKAGEADLILIKGIGPVTAKRILELRTRLNGISDIRQLMEIKGIKEKRMRQIEKYLYVEKKNV